MKFFKRKGFVPVFSVIVVAGGIVVFLNINENNKQSISENEVRSHLEQMYDAEVAGVTMKQDVYKALITKSGSVYVVEMNAVTGDVYSLEETDEFVVEKANVNKEESIEAATEKTLVIFEEPLLKIDDTTNSVAQVDIVKPPTKIIINEKPKNSSKILEKKEKSILAETITPKGVLSSQIKIEDKPSVVVKEEKPITEVLKEALKDVLKPETSKADETKEEKPKDEVAKTEPVKTEVTKTEVTKTEVTKTEASKTDVAKEESAKSESSKTEETKSGETKVVAPSQSPSLTAQAEAKKPETEQKTEKPATILISEDQAIKTAQQQVKGTVESSSFVKTNEGGYYLIVMKATLSESDSKDTAKAKQTKATIQVHSISGKILTVTWE
ncbi:hypothetical protein WAX74_07755 [Psychrobacillus sp. FJAT-51614]|uniref:PepSY domain-containing protein n=1 Tax=Psychrobacillus mangrovi TaxID=3117745 RepID=A0ABU8F463_9BACI